MSISVHEFLSILNYLKAPVRPFIFRDLSVRHFKGLRVSAFTQSAVRTAGPKFLSVSVTHTDLFSFRFLSSCLVLLLRLAFHCGLEELRFLQSSWYRLSSRSGFSCGGYQSDLTYNLGLKSWSPGSSANLWWRRTLRQKSCISGMNSVTEGGFRVGLNFKPSPKARDCSSVSSVEERLWNSKFRGSKSSKGCRASFDIHFSFGFRWSILRGLNLGAFRFLTLVDV